MRQLEGAEGSRLVWVEASDGQVEAAMIEVIEVRDRVCERHCERARERERVLESLRETVCQSESEKECV
jgi:hypothetical protein